MVRIPKQMGTDFEASRKNKLGIIRCYTTGKKATAEYFFS